jgi:hypothetical protein
VILRPCPNCGYTRGVFYGELSIKSSNLDFS